MTLISRSMPPTRETCATPFWACNSRPTVSSMNQEIWDGDMVGDDTA